MEGSDSNIETSQAILPIEVSLTLDGIGGLSVGNLFKLDYLPKVYNIPFKSPGRFEEDSRVNLAQDAINRARAIGDEQAVENIKNQLRIDLGLTNLGELIK